MQKVPPRLVWSVPDAAGCKWTAMKETYLHIIVDQADRGPIGAEA